MKKILLLAFTIVFTLQLQSQISAKLMRYMDVSDTQITFVYGGDIWIVPKTGGTAIQLTHSPGEESWPRFSPDGRSIAYTAQYHGNLDVYVMPSTGGLPTRVTYQSHADRMIDWYPDGRHLLFASNRQSGMQRYRQFFKVDKEGGLPEKLAVPYGELATFSPDGNKLAYITKITENYPFKRYRGGLTSDVIIFDLENNTAENITNNHANDGKPAWLGDQVFFLSDQGPNMRLNVWVYETQSKRSRQITNFEDFDISFLSAGPTDLVFEAGGTLYLMDGRSLEYRPVEVNVISDLSAEIARTEDVSDNINNMTAAPGSKRIVFEARGELFNVPAKDGYVLNLTQSSGAFDRDPAWSPDGKHLAFWSDRSGEYEIYLQAADGSAPAKAVTSRGKGFGYTLYWSPDSKKIAFTDETNYIYVLNIADGAIKVAGNNNWHITHPAKGGYLISWSPDSQWITFTQGLENANNAVFLYNVETQQSHQATNGFYNDINPVFSADGKYLFYLTNRNFSPHYSDMDATWVYPNATQIAAMSLTRDAPDLLAPKSDELDLKAADESEKEQASGDKKEEKSEKTPAVKIDLDGLEARLTILPPDAGNIGGIMPFEDKIIFLRFPNTGSNERSASLIQYDLKERKEETVMENVRAAVLSADGKMILVRSGSQYGLIKPAPKQKIEDAIPTDGLVMDLIPREEWRQIFMDTWRRHRDFFYDPNMQGVDWAALRDRYGALLDDARTRSDVSNIQFNLAAELSAGHTYTRGGDTQDEVEPRITGFLGIDWALGEGAYKIGRIVQPAAWDTEVRSPFDRPGVDVQPGDYILSVNGMSLDPGKDPYAAFEGLSGKTVVLMVSRTGKKADAKQVVVKCLTQDEELNLRYLEWIENNRKMVDKLSDGKLGYVYMSNTAGQGQRELVRMYYGQLDKQGIIIDERFNGGGQLADRFLELMQRPVVYNLHWRHGRDHTWPIKTNTGPMGMLINGWAGSGGDGLPWAFQELEAGPIVGERTLGILVGPATGHQLIDGGGITVPGARLYDNDGHWFWEGEGVKPDIEVWDDPNLLVQGRDPQIERVVEEVLKLLETNPPMNTPAPPLEDRTAEGQSGN